MTQYRILRRPYPNPPYFHKYARTFSDRLPDVPFHKRSVKMSSAEPAIKIHLRVRILNRISQFIPGVGILIFFRTDLIQTSMGYIPYCDELTYLVFKSIPGSHPWIKNVGEDEQCGEAHLLHITLHQLVHAPAIAASHST